MGAEELADRWRHMIEVRDAQVARLRRDAGEGEGFWDRRAEGFARTLRSFQPDRLLELMLARVTPGATVLDVGAGPGRYTLPLAQAGAQVTAVEPAQGMRSFLEQGITEGDIRNITVVPTSWQEADVAACDLVLCSHVIYGVRDILPFLHKLNDHARQACFIAMRVSQFDSYVLPLWEQIYGEARLPEPSFIDLYNLLYEMDIVPNVEIVPFGARRGVGAGGGFADREEAVARCREMLFLREDPATDQHIRDYLAERLREQEGRLVWRGAPMKAALVWWTQDDLHRRA